MNKKQLIAAIASTEYFETKKDAKAFLETFTDIISDTVASGQEVRITGFGKFEQFTQANGKLTPKFRPFKELCDKVA
jgi:nucleoid DNA-binding protein